MNSAFRALRLVDSEVISKYYSPPSSRRERFQNFRPLVTHKIMFWSTNYAACVVYTKTIIHLSVGESDGYLPSRENIHHCSPPLRWIIVKYHTNLTPFISFFFFRPTVGMTVFLWLFQLFLAHVIFRDKDYPNITVSIDNRCISLIFRNGVCCCCCRQFE